MTPSEEWRGDWATAEEQSLRAGLAATPEQRLEWLEAALEFAHAAGALELERERRVKLIRPPHSGT